MSSILDPQDAHFWIAVALVVFLLLLWRAKVPAMIARALDDAGAKVQAQLDEAARLRADADTLLAQIKTRREEAEVAAEDMMKAARADAERLRIDAQADLEDDIRRRRTLAERRIATAEALATAEVKAAAADLGAQIAERVLSRRMAEMTSDPLIDAGLRSLSERLS